MNSINIRKISLSLAICLAMFASFMLFFSTQEAKANPLYTASNCTVQTAAATSTVSYLFATTTSPTGTTTLIYDSYCLGNNQITDSAAMLMYMTASSTSSAVDINIEYSNGTSSGANCLTSPTLCDWYENRLDAVVATTTAPVALQQVSSFTWVFASSTPGKGPVTVSTNQDTRIFSLYTPMRYMRAIFTPRNAGTSGFANSAIWAQIVPLKQRQ